MPNHVTNRLLVFGPQEAITAFFADIKSTTEPDHVVDFNRIRPMPRELKNTISGSNDIISDERYAELLTTSSDGTREGLPERDFGSGHPISRSMAREYRERFGATNWYDWCNENWGTKWGAYNTYYDKDLPNAVWYQTAWSVGDINLLRELSQRHPLLTIVHDWADEDTGSNVGRRVWRNGLMSVCPGANEGGYYENDKRQAMLHAVALHRDEKYYYDKNDPAERWPWTYIDTEDDEVPAGYTSVAEEVQEYRKKLALNPAEA